MAMSAFYNRCPETALRETRCFVILSEAKIPKGEYVFFESYCDDPDCDCRRVMFFIYSRTDYSRKLATINFGWESVAYYTKWLHGNASVAEEMTQVTLEPFGEQSEYAQEFLEIAQDGLVRDPDFVERLKRHYAQFRASLPPARKRPGGGPRGPNFTPPRKKKKRK